MRERVRRSRGAVVVLLLVGLGGGATAAGAASAARAAEAGGAVEGETPTDAEKSEKPEPPAVIAVGELTAAAEKVAERLRAIDERLAEEGEVEKEVAEGLAGLQTGVEAAQARLDATMQYRALASEIETLRATWTNLKRGFESEQKDLGARAGRLDAMLAELADRRELWKRTKEAARKASAPPSVLGQADAVRKSLDESEARIKGARNRILELQAEISKQLQPIQIALTTLDAASAELAAALFERQDPLLWNALPAAGEIGPGLASVLTSARAMATELLDYAKRERRALLLQLALILGLGWLFSRSRSALRPERPIEVAPESSPKEASRYALEHPWAVALLFGLSFTAILQPERVRAIPLIMGTAILPVWLIVLRGMLPKVLHGPLLGLAIVAFLSVLRLGVASFEFLGRILLATQLAAAFAGSLWLRQPQRLAEIPLSLGHSFWFRVVDTWLRLAVPFLGVGFVAALTGYTNLADRIALGVLWGSVLGVGFVAIVRVLEAVLVSAIDAGKLDYLQMIRARRATFIEVAERGLRTLGFLSWLYLLLKATQLWGPARSALAALLGTELGYGPVVFDLGSVIAFGLTLWISWLLARFLSFTLDQEVFHRLRMPPGVPFALTTFTRYAVLVVGFVAAMAVIGFSLDRVTLLISALGVGIGFGLQNVVNHFVSGAILLFERPIRVGDRVQLDDLLGVVSDIGIRASTLRTFDGSDVIVPNGDLIAGRIVNWTLSDTKRRLILPVGVAYGSNPERVLEILESVASGHPDVLSTPAPELLFQGFGESSLDFELRAFTDSPRGWMTVRSELALATYRALQEAGIEIPFPQRDVHLRSLPRGHSASSADSDEE